MQVGQNNENDTVHFSPEWNLGTCFGPPIEWTYHENYTYYDRCCHVFDDISRHRVTLTCINMKSKFGWGNVTFKIDGKQYCDDFVGLTAMRTIFAKSKKKHTLRCK